MRTIISTLLFGSVLVLAAGCTAAPESVHIGTTELAVSLEGWEGIRNLSHEGEIYFGGQPDEGTLRRMKDELGIKLVINIRADSEMVRVGFDEPALVKELGMEYVNIPVTYDGFSSSDLDKFVKVIERHEGPLLFHCASSNRVGGLWATYLVLEKGMKIEAALEHGKAAGLRAGVMTDATIKVRLREAIYCLRCLIKTLSRQPSQKFYQLQVF